MYMVEDRDAHVLRYVHKCGCVVWERVCCVSQIYSSSLLRINEVLSVTQDMNYNFTYFVVL